MKERISGKNRCQGNEKQKIKECVDFFRGNPGYYRLMAALKDKYRSLGTLGGKIILPNLKEEEKLALGGLMRKDFSRRAQGEIQVSAIVAAFEGTKFQEVDFLKVLQSFWGGELLTKKEERSLRLQRRQEFFTRLSHELQPRAADWLKMTLKRKDNAYRMLITRYAKNRDLLENDLKAVSMALEDLPTFAGTKMQLPVFSSQITANPHYFDRETSAGQLLLYALLYIFPGEKPRNAFEEAELLYKGGLYGSEIANYTVCSGLLAFKKLDRNLSAKAKANLGTPLAKPWDNRVVHQGWLGFYQDNESLQVSLENLAAVEHIEGPGGKVFVVENPAVFSALAARCRKEYGQPLPLVCTNGQVNLATYILLEMLVAGGAILYYSGDFDPEGLLIANRLKKKFREALKLWCFSAEDYRDSLSKEKLAADRLKKLNRLADGPLEEIGSLMIEKKYAGYQESLIDKLWSDIEGFRLF